MDLTLLLKELPKNLIWNIGFIQNRVWKECSRLVATPPDSLSDTQNYTETATLISLVLSTTLPILVLHIEETNMTTTGVQTQRNWEE